MADTNFIKETVEPYVRSWLSTRFPDHNFGEKLMALTSGGHHRFDAVSEDDSIVAAVLCNRSRTSTGNENIGGVRKAKEDVALLNLLPSRMKKAMVFTNEGFCDLVSRRAKRLGTTQIEMLVCSLPDELNSRLNSVLDKASREQRSR